MREDLHYQMDPTPEICTCNALNAGCMEGYGLMQKYREADRAYRACALKPYATADELLTLMEARRGAFYAYQFHVQGQK